MKTLILILLLVTLLMVALYLYLRYEWKGYTLKRCCHYCERLYFKRAIKNGLKDCPYCGNPLSSWKDLF